MPSILYLFPDTNLFVQCRSLDQLDWKVLGSFDEIHLLVSRPVQSEIDNQKNKGRDRLGDRARSTSRLFREVILDPQGYKVVKNGKPQVRLFVRQDLKPNPALEQLDYGERDDQLVGITHAFLEQNAGLDVRVLTHDTGPMASAQMVGVPLAVVPDEWLLPPESSESEKKVKKLEGELARLKKAEPAFKILFFAQDADQPTDKLEVELKRYQPLTEGEVAELMSRIKDQYPLATDFGPREPVEEMRPLFGSTKVPHMFTPASDKEIAEYREKYAKWLERCEAKLETFHELLEHREGVPIFKFGVINDGTRPGKDVLITIEAKGDFLTRPPPYRGRDNKENTVSESMAMPAPPPTPHGTWRPESGRLGAHAFGAPYQDALRSMMGNREFEVPRMPHMSSLLPIDDRRDPNGFYYKPNRPSVPVGEFELECAQWRHAIDSEFFIGEIHIEMAEGQATGALECRIHAENLTDILVKRIPVTIEVVPTSAYEFAKNKVGFLLAGINM
jgi:hypothetical protein